MRIGWGAAAVLSLGLAGAAAAAPADNPYNDALLKMTPRARAGQLARIVGYWCIGTKTFFMGISREGPEAGFAYWSLTCLSRGSFAVQIEPSGHWAAVSCEQLAAQGGGRECFKKF